MLRELAVVVAVACVSGPVAAQTRTYSPLHKWQPAYSVWESNRTAVSQSLGRGSSGRPVLPGLRSPDVELLEDALLRKNHRSLKSDRNKARLHINRMFRVGQYGRNVLHGAMAEAKFLQSNPEWSYVSKPNASQHDVYRWLPGRSTPMTGQVKFHVSGDARRYAADMLRDFRSERFFVPDDHAPALKEFLLKEAANAKAAGDLGNSNVAYRNYGRVAGMGVSATQIRAGTREAYRSTAMERNASYLSFGAAIALSFGQTAWDFSHGAISQDQASLRATKAATLLGTGIAAEMSLAMIRQGAIRGTLRGNLLVGAAVAVVDVSWAVYENGGLQALSQPGFYEQVGGGVSGVALGSVAAFYAAAATSEFGPIVAGISGLAAGTVVGTTAYFGGRATTRWLARSISPGLYQRLERQQFEAANRALLAALRDAQNID